MEKMSIDTAKEHLAKAIGASYNELVQINEQGRRSLRIRFYQRKKLHPKPSVKVYTAGSPYLMLSRKINIKGKRVK